MNHPDFNISAIICIVFYEEVFRPQDIADIEALEEIEQMEHKDE
jgi:hypothetical protein